MRLARVLLYLKSNCVCFAESFKMQSLLQSLLHLFHPSFTPSIEGQLFATESSALVSSQRPSPCDMSNQSQAANLISALGTLIGYIGSEAATEDVFERLLWPQRFLNAVSWRDTLHIGLLMPMGGPIHKAALTTLDKFYHNGLFKGRSLGNMLGTAFFHNTDLKYKVHNPASGLEGKEHVRNGLWPQAIAHMAVESRKQQQPHPETGEKVQTIVRANTVVSFLELSYADSKVDPTKVVQHDTGRVSVRTYLALIWSEITGLAMGAFVIAIWRSYLSFIWFIPLALKILSAACTIPREGLLDKPIVKDQDSEETKLFDVNTKGNGFLVIAGKESVVLQFFRHYGHPKRDRVREFIQISLVVGSGFVFPVGLVVSLVWMPFGMQYAWLGYQLYATTAMYIYRYTRSHQSATTEARLAQIFAQGKCEERIAYLRDGNGIIVKGRLTRTPVGRYAEGQKVTAEYLSKKPKPHVCEKGDMDSKVLERSETRCESPQ